ncbi:unknown [Clostridium sp. CAG:921]|nr:unknown [Clostridium sp. CAG:921]
MHTCILVPSNFFISALSAIANPSIANFDEQYGDKKGIVILPASELKKITFPYFFCIILLSATWVILIFENTFVLNTSIKSEIGTSLTLPEFPIAALFIITSKSISFNFFLSSSSKILSLKDEIGKLCLVAKLFKSTDSSSYIVVAYTL